MADIVIRGIEMPKEPTPLTLYQDGRWNDYTDGAKGEFVLLPEGHGNLIDVNSKIFPTLYKNPSNDYMKGWNACLRSVQQQPTIIPAEGHKKLDDLDMIVKELREADEKSMCGECGINLHNDTTKKGILFAKAADAIEELKEELANKLEWIPTTKKLPEDFQKVLVFWTEHSQPMIDTAFWQEDARRFDGHHWVRMVDKVSHWMPLPEPPAEGGNADGN